MKKKVGKIPVNARIDIDYTGKKPKIKFTYPQKDAVNQNMAGGMHIIILLLIWYIFIGLLCSNIYTSNKELPKECFFTGINISDRGIDKINLRCDDTNYNITFKERYNKFTDEQPYSIKEDRYKSFLEENYYMTIFLGSLLFTLFIGWILTIILVRCKWYQRINPKFQASIGHKYYRKFYPKDIEYNVAIIPKFSNVEMNYNATKDFSKYLAKVSVRELQYQRIKKKKKGKKKKDIYRWSAIFYFKEKPKNGFLEVTYQ